MSVSSTARRLFAAGAVAAAVVGAAALPASAADHNPGRPHADVSISDVQHSVRGHDRSPRALNQEWVEITNDTRRTVDLDGWTLSDRDGHTYTFRHVRLAGHDSVRVHTGVGRDSRHDLFQDRRREVWDTVDTATLRNDHGRLVDVVSWGRDHRGGHFRR
ncbi:lamin tail domain-containing protein [Streptomyces mangrovisoli]|uniref:LTD domain-containing protein n=1 Tax=Streptomyces mangrovisoli TaxID=1428628 RepID=A0A1J4P1E8_9ACTN|nr:lamin tail domain-containing protein [Streptomyces mangrovisoli]OIJ68050.1 hypothetical protein WN71_009625 [Streptomyces mangrovisoli]